MISWKSALRLISKHTKRLETSEIDIIDSMNSVLAEDVRANCEMPPFDKSAMDGYAVRAVDTRIINPQLKSIGLVRAGEVFPKRVNSGKCIKIMTGAPIPEGADAVIKIEDTQLLAQDQIRVMKKINAGDNVCLKGEDVKRKDITLKKNTLIKSPEIAILASMGKAKVKVYRKPQIAIISTGNEIVGAKAVLRKGKIRDTNGPLLLALSKILGFQADYLGIAQDNEEELRELIERGLRYDLLLISGGVSMGDYDLVPKVLKKKDVTILFHKIAVKPGKPLVFGKKAKTVIFGIPGNPVSNLTSFHMFIKPSIYKMVGRNDYALNLISACIVSDFQNRSDRVSFIPSRFNIVNGCYEVHPIRLHGSADIFGCTQCNCFMIIEKNTKLIKKRKRIKITVL